MRSKLLVSALVAAVAFLLATNPVVVEAAGQVTSAQIKNGTVKSVDIKDDQVTGKDVKESSARPRPAGRSGTTLSFRPR